MRSALLLTAIAACSSPDVRTTWFTSEDAIRERFGEPLCESVHAWESHDPGAPGESMSTTGFRCDLVPSIGSAEPFEVRTRGASWGQVCEVQVGPVHTRGDVDIDRLVAATFDYYDFAAEVVHELDSTHLFMDREDAVMFDVKRVNVYVRRYWDRGHGVSLLILVRGCNRAPVEEKFRNTSVEFPQVPSGATPADAGR